MLPRQFFFVYPPQHLRSGITFPIIRVPTATLALRYNFSYHLSLLDEAREKTEAIIDTLHQPFIGKKKKVRTYRKKARKAYLAIAKKKKVGKKAIRKGIKKQLNYVARNLRHINELAEEVSLSLLSKKQYRDLFVIGELQRQQEDMYKRNNHSVQGRIVSILS
jgi:IS5 family transposase